MKKMLLCILLPLLCHAAYSQSVLEVLQHNGALNQSNRNVLVMVSSTYCGHCMIALKDLKPLLRDSLDIVVVHFGNPEDKQELSDLYKSYQFIDAENLKGLKEHDTFPTFYLYDTNQKLIWKKVGWFKKHLKTIARKIKHS